MFVVGHVCSMRDGDLHAPFRLYTFYHKKNGSGRNFGSDAKNPDDLGISLLDIVGRSAVHCAIVLCILKVLLHLSYIHCHFETEHDVTSQSNI